VEVEVEVEIMDFLEETEVLRVVEVEVEKLLQQTVQERVEKFASHTLMRILMRQEELKQRQVFIVCIHSPLQERLR
jgi:hypothetical protein